LLALQQKTNQRLRELEFNNDEKTSLLRAALLDRDNLTPELLEIMRAELLQRVKGQIERVVQAPSETQPEVLDSEATEIAKIVMESQVALDDATKVSIPLLSCGDSGYSLDTFGSPREAKGSPLSASTLLSPSKSFLISPKKACLAPLRDLSMSQMSTTSTGTYFGTWDRLSQMVGGRKKESIDSITALQADDGLKPDRVASPSRGFVRIKTGIICLGVFCRICSFSCLSFYL
jgi:protein HOOK3